MTLGEAPSQKGDKDVWYILKGRACPEPDHSFCEMHNLWGRIISEPFLVCHFHSFQEKKGTALFRENASGMGIPSKAVPELKGCYDFRWKDVIRRWRHENPRGYKQKA